MLLLLIQATIEVGAPPEKRPALLTLIYTGGLVLLALLLLFSSLRQSLRRRRFGLDPVAVADDLPIEVRGRLGSTTTNRGLRILRWVFVGLILAVFGFHIYWARYAEDSNERLQELSYKDLRNRRLQESTLRGWIFDRTHRHDRAFALYQRQPNGQIVRAYPMDAAMAHLLGSDRGDPGLERALFGIQSGAVPEALDVVTGRDIKQPANLDVRLTIDSELQKAAVEQLKNRPGAVVILNPQTGEVLAMYSNPAYSLEEVRDESTWIRLNADERDRPLVNRALGAYYIPGSTFKTVTMIAAYLAGIEDFAGMCSSSGYVAQPGAKVIFDDGGAGEVHGRIGMDVAYEVSCNQYFARLAVELGPERMKQGAEALGIGAYDRPLDATLGGRQPEIWNASAASVARALAPRQSTMVTSKNIRPFDLALEGYGQGYAGQMTPFQMALAAAAVANLEGKLMKPKIEYDLPPAIFKQVTTPERALEMRRIMGRVTGGAQGTARGVFGPVHAAGIITGGKTGTAQKDVPVYNPRTGEPVTVKKVERDPRGNVIREYEQTVMAPEPRVDSWFLCIAPLERPTLAMAVVIDGGGYGSRAAAPVAAALVLKARELGIVVGAAPAPQQQPPGAVSNRARRPQAAQPSRR
ncbi:MAG: penicillin-binding transpeptidase domain-containing protein [Pyrinomonadaceae bacterium]